MLIKNSCSISILSMALLVLTPFAFAKDLQTSDYHICIQAFNKGEGENYRDLTLMGVDANTSSDDGNFSVIMPSFNVSKCKNMALSDTGVSTACYTSDIFRVIAVNMNGKTFDNSEPKIKVSFDIQSQKNSSDLPQLNTIPLNLAIKNYYLVNTGSKTFQTESLKCDITTFGSKNRGGISPPDCNAQIVLYCN